jgi:hypothetical protein
MIENDQQVINAQVDWHSKGSQGCSFAQYLHTHSENLESIHRVVLSGSLSDEIIDEMKAGFARMTQVPTNQILSFIIPSITTNTDLADFVGLIRKNASSWRIESDVEQNLVLMKISVPMVGESDSNGVQVYAWMLSFGPFEHYAPTRKSPYFEILLATKSKQQLKTQYSRFSLHKQLPDSQERKGAEHDAHLADLYIRGLTNDIPKDKKYWSGAINMKKAKLGGASDFNAKARVTLTLLVD